MRLLSACLLNVYAFEPGKEHSVNERCRGEANLASKTLGFNSQLKPVVDIAIRGIASINADQVRRREMCYLRIMQTRDEPCIRTSA